ncbi:3HB-oligomer hydrolase (3HBOH) [Burkholderiales bacterium JOSHI_001]|nr:3HB-oligomer hydrolase (3HBOH) [Burkholderiales bacterium JOSHI_001]
MKTKFLQGQRLGLSVVAAAALLAACGGGGGSATDSALAQVQSAGRGDDSPPSVESSARWRRVPAFIQGEIRRTDYDGVADDLLTAGLGQAGLATAAPTFANPLAPTAAELRRLHIVNSYRAIVDTTAGGGYGTLYGPTVAADGTVTAGDGKVAGTEWLAFSDDGSGQQNVTLMVQVPASFNPRKPCIITATSSGSRGVYGAISTGEWGLKRGCAVAYTDKGTGSAPHDLATDTVPLIDGTRSTSAAAGTQAQFRAPLDAAQLAAVNAAMPNRLAFKHAHSQRNPERDWGRFTLQAVEFAFYALNQQFNTLAADDDEHDDDSRRARRIRPGNTLVIASSVSNGGGAAIAAAELDREGLIDGVAVAEPAVEMPAAPGITVRRGGVAQATVARPLIDFTSFANLYQPCAALSAQVAGSPGSAFVVASVAAARCASLKAKGLLTADTLAAQADEALAQLAAYGWEPEAAVLQASHAAFEIPSAVSVTFANALSRASVADALCGYSFAATSAAFTPAAVGAAALAGMAATGNGVPPSATVQLINNLNPGFAFRDLVSFSPSTGKQDWNVDGALCLRQLVTGSDAAALKLQAGLDETRRSGNLGRKPTVIVHGRSDALLPVNHTSRAYTALNSRVEGRRSKLSYIEVTNAQHFDAFIGLPAVLPGYDSRFVPIHVYLNRALDAVHAHLADGRALPPSQVVRTTPRGGLGGSAPVITEANAPAIALKPAAADAISARNGVLDVPN